MSKATDAGPDPEGWDSLREVFHKEITENGGDSARAFIATLDELDARLGVSDDQIARNSDLLDTAAKWLTLTNDRLKAIQAQIEDGTARGADRLSAGLALAAGKGAREGAAASHAALGVLREAMEDYHARKRRIARAAVVGLPLIFSAALLTAFLFASLVIPALPRDWQWPCTIIGAEFRPNVDPDRATTFCVIVRE